MKRSLLALNVLAAANAANAWRPFDRFDDASVPCFFAGLPTSELPLYYLAAHAAVNVAGARRGAFRGPAGLASAALATGTAAVLAGLARAEQQAKDVYQRAMDDGLGPGYRDRVQHPRYPGPDAAVARTPGAVRMMRIRRRFALDADVSYGPAGAANHLDIWHRADLPRDGAAPVLLQVPGGAWMYGNKQGQAYPLMSHLAERGWICVSMSYRLSPRATWPDQIVDVKRALAWIRRHIPDYGGDPGFVAVTGGSAGGHLSSLAALTPGRPEWQPGFEDADTSVAAAVPFYGVYDWVDEDKLGHHKVIGLLARRVVKQRPRDAVDVFRDASPVHRLTPDAPPFFVSHGVNDSLVPIEQGREFVRRLSAVSANPVVFAELPKAQHAFDVFGSPRSSAAAEAVADFLGVVYADYLRDGTRAVRPA